MNKKSKGTKSKSFGKINKAWKGDKVKTAQKKSLKVARKGFKAELSRHVKAAKVKVKKVEIRVDYPLSRNYCYGRPGAETWSGGYARPFTAKRGAERHFKDFIAKGGKLLFIKNY